MVNSESDITESQEHSGADETVVLYRPMGQKELDLIHESGNRAFPPRLSWQPIFYPVLDESYAVQIARDWNAKDEFSGYAGYVTRFRVRAAYLSRLPQPLPRANRRQPHAPRVLDSRRGSG